MGCDHFVSCAECMADLDRELSEIDEQGARDQAEHRLIEASGRDLADSLADRANQAERDARLATQRAERAEAALRDLMANSAARIAELEAALAGRTVSCVCGAQAGVAELKEALRELRDAVDVADFEVDDDGRIDRALDRASKALRASPSASAPHLRRGDVVRVKGSALVELRGRLGDVLDVSGGEVLVNVATAQGPQRHWLFVEQVESTQTARLPAGCACGGEGWCDACQIATSGAPPTGSESDG